LDGIPENIKAGEAIHGKLNPDDFQIIVIIIGIALFSRFSIEHNNEVFSSHHIVFSCAGSNGTGT
jgi:hypothetical protein